MFVLLSESVRVKGPCQEFQVSLNQEVLQIKRFKDSYYLDIFVHFLTKKKKSLESVYFLCCTGVIFSSDHFDDKN